MSSRNEWTSGLLLSRESRSVVTGRVQQGRRGDTSPRAGPPRLALGGVPRVPTIPGCGRPGHIGRTSRYQGGMTRSWVKIGNMRLQRHSSPRHHRLCLGRPRSRVAPWRTGAPLYEMPSRERFTPPQTNEGGAMSKESYDAIVIGARCAGSPTAMLLARKNYRVLLLDKATFPSDTMSTHMVHPPGVAALQRWGLLERLEATGVPPVETYSFDFGPLTISGSPRPIDGIARGYCSRRTVLDKLLVDAAVEAGAELREGFTVDEVMAEQGRVVGIRGHGKNGSSVSERARVVIGADGRNSRVAATVQAQRYSERPPLLASYYSYWSGLPMRGRF